jgi:hypothetical protein
MTRLQRFNRWLSTPFREVRKLFPFTHEGRQTLIYIIFAGAGPALCVICLWAMNAAAEKGWNAVFANLAYKFGWANLIIVSGLACFVSIRSIKMGKDGFGVEGIDQGNAPPTPIATTTTTTKTEVAAPPPATPAAPATSDPRIP